MDLEWVDFYRPLNNCEWHTVDFCERGDLESAKLYCKDKNNSDYIFFSSISGNLELVKYLHTQGFKIDDGAIPIAAEYGHLPIVEYLVSINAPITSDALIQALIEPHIHIVKYLLSIEAPVHRQAVYVAAQYDIDLAKYLMWNTYNQQHVPRIKELLTQEILPIILEFLGDPGEIVFDYCA